MDYLSSSDKKDENVICSVCCEMKNESNVSQNRKKNSDHFKKLDEDRKKKKRHSGIADLLFMN